MWFICSQLLVSDLEYKVQGVVGFGVSDVWDLGFKLVWGVAPCRGLRVKSGQHVSDLKLSATVGK